jgi:DNA-binding transcriptional ArsR family regulator
LAEQNVFAALADPTRRQLIEWLSDEGSGTATTFANRLPITRQAVTKHLRELEAVGIVTASKKGRETRYALEAQALEGAAAWLADRAAAWDTTLARLKNLVED